jgi:hypothetical protein
MSHQNRPPTGSVPVTSRAQVLRAILSGLNAGELPAPREIRFGVSSVNIVLDSIADLDLWADYFEFGTAEIRYRGEQPHPNLADPANSDEWYVTDWRRWNGWHFTLSGADPITDAQRQQWIDSGQAAQFQAKGGADDE